MKAKRVLFSQYAVLSRRTAKQVAEDLVETVEEGDRLLVSEITQNTAWMHLRTSDDSFEQWINHARP